MTQAVLTVGADRRRPFDVAREIARRAVAGLVAGVVVGGIGGRIAMRLSFLIDRGAAGVRTENGATVGEFTLGGTVGLVIFGGLFAGIGTALLWVVIRPWLPERRRARTVASVVGAMALAGGFAINGNNFDFRVLDPPLAHAALFLGLAGVGGWFISWFDDVLARRAQLDRRAADLPSVAVVVIGMLFVGPTLFSFFTPDGCGCRTPARLPGVLLIVLGTLTLWTWIAQMRGATVPSRRSGRLVLAALVVSSFFHLGGEIAYFVP
jgi:hypothetical protein